MSIRELLACCVIVSLSGCLYHARERTDGTVSNLVSHPYDVMPAGALVPAGAPAAPAPKVPPCRRLRKEQVPRRCPRKHLLAARRRQTQPHRRGLPRSTCRPRSTSRPHMKRTPPSRRQKSLNPRFLRSYPEPRPRQSRFRRKTPLRSAQSTSFSRSFHPWLRSRPPCQAPKGALTRWRICNLSRPETVPSCGRRPQTSRRARRR